MNAGALRVRPAAPEDREWVERFTCEHWGTPVVAVHGRLYRPDELPGFIAEDEARRGLSLVKVYRDAVSVARRLKPSIPLVGEYGIPIRDELELELLIDVQRPRFPPKTFS